jgi:NAD(P)-dependent dehydrogenase (short-subunit alcohol dehydrogenase family)
MSADGGELRFDGRVAIVTGAGGNPGLGRTYARLLASRGAKVLVNDLGVGPDGRGVLPANAEAVAQEIRDAGGEAIADGHSVAEEDSARAIVQTAIDAWGQVDILINNAGIVLLVHFDEISSADIERITRVHLLGTTWMCRAVWDHMAQRGYGRIVNTSSGSLVGQEFTSIYGAAKGGILSLSRALAVEGAEAGIVVNAIVPGAATAAFRHSNVPDDYIRTVFDTLDPELVAPTVAYLAHEDCELQGRCLDVAAGRVSELFYGRTRGFVDREHTPEDVRDRLEQVLDREGYEEPARGKALFTPKPYRPA